LLQKINGWVNDAVKDLGSGADCGAGHRAFGRAAISKVHRRRLRPQRQAFEGGNQPE
jgi:hypothetical protein